jgi:translation initiation factor 1
MRHYRGVTDNTRVVYADACQCGQTSAAAAGTRTRRAPPLPADGVVRVWRDRRRRRGKTVTVVAGVTGDAARLQEAAGLLKRACGSGGTVQDDGTIEIQGDHRERIAAKLGEQGYRVKLAGG